MPAVKLHLTDDGPKKCTATKRPCRYAEQPHFTNVYEANQAYEEKMAEKHGNLPDLLKRRRLEHNYDQSFLNLPNNEKLQQYNEQCKIVEQKTKDGLTFQKIEGQIIEENAGFHNVHISGKINPELLNENSYKDFSFAKYDHSVNFNRIDLSGSDNRSHINEKSVKQYHALESGESHQSGIKLDNDTRRSIQIYSSESGYKAFQNYARTGELNHSDIVQGTLQETFLYNELQNETDETFKQHIEKMDEYVADGYKVQRRLFRGMSQEDHGVNVEEWLSKHPIGETFENQSFTATSASSGAALARAQQGGNKNNTAPNIVFDIISSQGRALGRYSRYQVEKEVLLPRNSRFMVVGIDRDVEVESSPKNYSVTAFVKIVQVDEDNNIL